MLKHVPGKHALRHVPIKHVPVRQMLGHVLKDVPEHVPQNRHPNPQWPLVAGMVTLVSLADAAASKKNTCELEAVDI